MPGHATLCSPANAISKRLGVSRLTTGRTRHFVHYMQLTRHLVTGNVFTRVFLQAANETSALPRRATTAATLLPKRSSGSATTRQSNTAGWLLVPALLLPEILFTAGIDAVGTATVNGNAVVLFQASLVAQQQPGLAINIHDGFRRLSPDRCNSPPECNHYGQKSPFHPAQHGDWVRLRHR